MEGVKSVCHAPGLSIAFMLPHHSQVRPGVSVCKEQVQFLPPGAPLQPYLGLSELLCWLVWKTYKVF